jgi:PilZ domain
VEFLGTIAVSFQDRSGRSRVTQGKSIDASEAGMQIEVTERIEAGSSITVRPEKQAVPLQAAVRYCRQEGPRFRLGLQFNPGVRLRLPALPATV